MRGALQKFLRIADPEKRIRDQFLVSVGDLRAAGELLHVIPISLRRGHSSCRGVRLLKQSRCALRNLAREGKERFGMWRILASKYRRQTGIATFTNIGIELNRAQVWHAKLLRRALHPALGENVDLVMAVRAEELAHVLYYAEDVYLHTTKHLDGFARILKRNI